MKSSRRNSSRKKSGRPPERSEKLELRIEDLSRGGAGVGKDPSGRVIFVPFTAPGDQVEVEVVRVNKNYAQGKLSQVLVPSPVRIPARCPAFARCGGCEWQHLPYELQWKTKLEGVRHALGRVGISSPPQIQEIPAQRIWEYRNRIQLRGHREVMGFYASGSHEVIPLERCDIARPEMNAVWGEIRAEGSKLSRPYKVEVEISDQGIRKSWNSRHGALGFRQIHDEQNTELRKVVGGFLSTGRVLYDLYGGSGNLSIPLADRMAEIHCVDLSVPGQEFPGKPANLTFHRNAVADWLDQQGASSASRPASAILDPPREGLAQDFSKIADSLVRMGVNEAVLVGCDSDAWARDLSRFTKRGWRLEAVAVLDLFPQTHHVEAVALLVL